MKTGQWTGQITKVCQLTGPRRAGEATGILVGQMKVGAMVLGELVGKLKMVIANGGKKDLMNQAKAIGLQTMMKKLIGKLQQ